MATIWIVVADRQRARILETTGPVAPLHEITDLVHTEARLRGQDLAADRPGRSFSSHSPTRHAMEPSTPPREREADTFARDIVSFLVRGLDDGAFAELVLCAEPRMLGLLRAALPSRLAAVVRLELDRDLTHLTRPEDIRGHLPERLK